MTCPDCGNELRFVHIHVPTEPIDRWHRAWMCDCVPPTDADLQIPAEAIRSMPERGYGG